MITTIGLKNVASYDPEGATLKDLKKLNFFFGYNGSGKSTIAKYLYSLSPKGDDPESHFAHCTNLGFDSNAYDLLVFDEKFVERNFVLKNSQSGIFSLNEKNEEIDRQIAIEEESIKTIEAYLNLELPKRKNAIGKNKNDSYETLKRACFTDRNQFKAFTKLKLKHGGSSENHLSELKKILLAQRSKTHSFQNLNELYTRLYEKELVRIGLFFQPVNYKRLRKIEQKLEVLLNEIIVGNDDVEIAELIRKLNNKNWVEEGYNKYVLSPSNTCPFCQKSSISPELILQFESLFNETYKSKINTIKHLLQDYMAAIEIILNDVLSIQALYNEKNIATKLYLSLKDLFDKNLEILTNKIVAPNERKTIGSIALIKKEISDLNKLILENDNLFDSLDDERKKLDSSIWLYLALNSKDSIDDHDLKDKKYSRIMALTDELEVRTRLQVANHQSNVAELRGKTISTGEAVKKINILLKNAGFENFEIVERKGKVNNISHYYLKRGDENNDHVFKSLSEGEKNFISFLYFYQQCLGLDSISNLSKKKIVVIDDPVSSMDSKVLFIISTLIRQLIQSKGKGRQEKKEFRNSKIHQVFILSHNIYFHKEVSFNSNNRICSELSHFHVTKSKGSTRIILVDDKFVKNDYSLLWSSIMDIKRTIDTQNKSNNVFLANSMRRILETYVNFIGLGKSDWDCLSKIDDSHPLFILYHSFLSFINDGSHKVSPLDDVYYQNIINQDPSNLFVVFETIFREIGSDHYDYMQSA